jgi:hypothetical protein
LPWGRIMRVLASVASRVCSKRSISISTSWLWVGSAAAAAAAQRSKDASEACEEDGSVYESGSVLG